jgi:dihydrolipoamide dehydrogenase
MVYDYDVVVIGAGPGGYVAAIAAAQKKLKVACVDKNVALGGTCLNVGCIPSKILLHISHFYEEAHINAEKYGMSFAGLSYDWSKIQKIKQDRISELNKGITALFKKNGVTFFNGEASFVNANKIKVGQAEITADKFIIASGSSPSSLPNIEIDEEKIVSSTGALSLKTVPENLVIIGAGYIGLELGSVYAKLGSKVKVIEFADKVTPAMDAEISISFKKILEQQGIEFYMQHKVLSAVATKNDVAVVSESLEGGKKI